MTQVKSPIALISVFVWIGFVCAISFMEAWLKFQAPGIDLAIGLGIGKLVFAALNKVEWVLGISIFISLLLAKENFIKGTNLLYLFTMLILLVQSFWLLPALDERADLYIQQVDIGPSNLHFYYVAMEVLKVFCLTIFGIKLFKGNK